MNEENGERRDGFEVQNGADESASYSSPENGDGYERPDFNEEQSENEVNSTAGAPDSGNRYYTANAHGNDEDRYRNDSGYYGRYYPQQGTPAAQYPTKVSGKNNGWIIAIVAIAVSFCLMLGGLFIFLSVWNDRNGAGGALGENGGLADGGQSGNGEGGSTGSTGGSENAPPFLGGGDIVLEQLPSDSIYYTIPSVVAKTKDTVVEITTETVTTGGFFNQYVTEGAGSGVIFRSYDTVGESGVCGTYIVTNNHVIEGATNIKVKLTNGAEYAATLIGSDPKTDIAVIHINEKNLPEAELGKSDTLVAGQGVVVIGNPLGSLGGSVSSGIISCTERDITISNNVMKLIQITAAVNPGNSGGALFDLEGKLIGIVNAKYSDEQIEGIGFSIPINIAKAIASDLMNYGYVTGRPNHGITPYYGMCVYNNRYYVNYEGVNVNGIWASSIAEGSDCANVGMQPYDQIVSIVANDGNTYTFSSLAAISVFLDSLKVGDTVTINAYRYKATSSFMGPVFTREELSFTFTVTENKG